MLGPRSALAAAAALTALGCGTATADPAAAVPGDGTYLVGVDIRPGIYQAPGDPGSGCFWQRLWKVWEPGRGEDPNSDVIASDLTRTSPVRVLIKPTDVAFHTAGCGAWTMMPAPPDTGSYGPGGMFGSEY